ncbi:MAG: hypothetical protein MJY83_05030 [Bacteroidales bacterium]|nr:hypothetical protein [Bacteroidales bacterium]
MKTKLLNALKSKYAELGTSERALEGLASIMAKSVTEESDVESAVADEAVAGLLKSLSEETKAIREKLAASEKANHDKEVIARVHELMKASGCTNEFIRNMTLKGVVVNEGDTPESLAKSYKDAYNANFKEAYGDGAIPPISRPNPEGYRKGDYKGIAEKLKRSGDIPSKE